MIIIISMTLTIISTAGSLFYSEVMGYPPCDLCWYQRVFMYPLVLVFTTAYLFEDKKYYRYSLPLSLSGTLFSVYHQLIIHEVIPESFSPCTENVSCSTVYVEYFGFITIPIMSLSAFILINFLSFKSMRNNLYEN